MDLSSETIEQAFASINPLFTHTPQFELETLNTFFGLNLVLKVETLNPIRSFKGRGADFFVQQQHSKNRLVCASAGNFGQGMAYACRAHKIPLSIFAATTANPLKVARMKALGADVTLAGSDFDAAKDAGKAYASELGLRYVEDGKDEAVSIGAGTIGLELSRYPTVLDTVLIPLGNGALINGIGTWFKAKYPATKIIGVVAEKAPSMAHSWREQKLLTSKTAPTIADGIAVRKPVPEALEHMKTTMDDVIEVSEASILAAMKLIHQHAGLAIEPAGAVGVAALLEHSKAFKGQSVATILCGGNMTQEQMKKWL